MNLTTQTAEPAGFVPPPANLSRAARSWRWVNLLAALFILWLIPSTARADISPPGCTGSGLGILLFTSESSVHVGDTIHYNVTVFNGTGNGPVVCDATSIQAFLVTPDGVSHQITLVRTNLYNGQSDYYASVLGANPYIVRAQDIQAGGTLRATASDSGVIHQNIVNSEGGGNQGVNTLVSLPCIQIAASCSSSVGENGVITFSGTVTNCGNDTLVNVAVTNFVNGGLFPVTLITNLLVGQAASFSGSYVPANPCTPTVATITATGTDQYTDHPRTVTSSVNITCANALTAGIVVTKACPLQPVAPGQLLTYSGSVSNSGNVTLNNVVVVDNQPVANTQVFTVPTLLPGGIAYFTAGFVAPANACSVSDILTGSGSSVCGVPVNNSVSTTCPLLTTPQISVNVVCPPTPVSPGGTLVFNGTVLNTGNIALVNVVVYSSQPVPNTRVFTLASLVPGATANFSGAYSVPANACSLTTLLTATGTGICGLTPVTNTAATTCPVTTAPAIAVSLACPSATAIPGGLATYSGTVRNTGNVILNNVYVVNSQPYAGAPVIGPITLAVGAVANFSASFTVPLDACSVSSTVTASGSDNCTALPVSNTATATCPLLTTPAISINQTCPPTPVGPGGLLTYSGSVSNAGNITLTNIVVLNNLSGGTPVLTLATLAPGQTAGFTGSYVAPTNCTVTSTSAVTGRSLCGIVVASSVTSTCAITTTPALALTQNCPVVTTAPGTLMTYTGTVTNTGNITLNNVVVVNNLSGASPIFRAGSLAPGVGASFSGSYVTPTNCSVTSISSATAQSICGVPATATVSSTCTVTTTPSLRVTQNCPANPTVPGALLTYTGSVINTGNIPINNVVVVNDQSGVIFTAAVLAPGASAGFSGSFLTPTNCSVTSTSTASGLSACGVATTNTVTSTCVITTTPALTINQNCPPGPVVPGGTLTYSGSVLNSGNITITNILVYNNLSGLTPVATIASLAPGAAAGFSGSYLAPTNCSSTSTATVSGRSICGIAISSSVITTCPIGTTPLLTITQNCPLNPPAPGAVLAYSGTVANTGNITLTNVVVVNNLSGATPVFHTASLAPGATALFVGSFVTPTNCSVTSISTASAQSTCGIAVTNLVVSTCPVNTTPSLKVTQNCPAGPTVPGGQLTFTGTVTNTGNIAITNVVVANDHSGSIYTAAYLAPGAGSAFMGSYATPANCSATSTSTATGVSLCGVEVANSATSTCAITTVPALVLIQACPANPGIPGGLLTYSGSVSNAGNILITNVVVLNGLSGATPVFTAAALAPGQTTNFTGSYVAPTNCSSTSTSIATGRSICDIAVSSTATTTCPILTTPAITVIQYCPSTPVFPGGLLTYSGTVSNAGNITLTNIIVVSDRPAKGTTIFTLVSLAPGATAIFSGSFVTPLNCCVVSSTVTASGQACSGANVSDTFTRTCIVLTQPGIVVATVCSPGILHPGDLLTYSGSVSNSGNITLIDVTVTDDEARGNPPLPGPIDLAPGESVAFFGSFLVLPDFCGTHTVTASGMDVCTYLPVQNSLATTCPITTNPRITVTKNCPLLPTPRGGLYTYSGSVSNAGNISLMNVVVVNNQPTNNTPVLGPFTLAPGASLNFTNSYVAPACCCLIIDTLTARGTANCTVSNVSDTATEVCPLLTTPGIAVVENCPATLIPMGGQFMFSGYVTNTGNVVLTNVWVFGPLGTNDAVLGPLQLAPGESETYFGSFTNVFNSSAVTITAVGQETCGGTFATNSASCPVVTTPGISRTAGLNGITFPTTVGKSYTVQYKNNLADPAWNNLSTITGTGANQTVVDTTAAGQPARYYRVMVTP